MAKIKNSPKILSATLAKSPTGVEGLDNITGGGLPKGRPSLVCGGAGCGKTVLCMEFLVRGALQFNEPGVFMSFEETEKDLVQNFRSLGLGLDELIAKKKIAIDHVFVERREIEETGEYDLEGLFIRLEMAINEVKAKRVVLDTIETLFSGFSNEGILRAELRRLFRWLKERGVTAIITAERGKETFSRHGLEEYVADCVILLDHRVENQLSTRRLRIVKYRGAAHAADEYPFIIGRKGISLIPLTSAGLDHPAPMERIPSGIERLDAMLEGKGYFRGSTVLISGTAGTGKTSVAAHFVNSACSRKERALYLTFEESPPQIVRNMGSIGIKLERWTQKGLLQFLAVRPTFHGLEAHLRATQNLIDDFKPAVVVIDPISNLITTGNLAEVKSMLVRLIDHLKSNAITSLCTDLTPGGETMQQTEAGISSLADTWILLRCLESTGERNRTLYIAKSRGMKHSEQIREFRFTEKGIQLTDVYLGQNGVFTGSARVASESKDNAEESMRKQRAQHLRSELERKKTVFDAEVAALKAKFDYDLDEIKTVLEQEEFRTSILDKERDELAVARGADFLAPPGSGDRIGGSK